MSDLLPGIASRVVVILSCLSGRMQKLHRVLIMWTWLDSGLLISCDLSVIKTLVISQNSDLEGGSRLVKAVAVWF